MNYCEVMLNIQKNPRVPVDLTVRQYFELVEHIDECAECMAIADAVLEAGKNLPPSEDMTKYN